MMTGSFLREEGIYPAWHMNKTHWLSVAVDGSTDEERLRLLLDISFELTSAKIRSNRKEKKK